MKVYAIMFYTKYVSNHLKKKSTCSNFFGKESKKKRKGTKLKGKTNKFLLRCF
jgi:hypothetical protein